MIQFVTNPTELDVIQLMQLPVSVICYSICSFMVCTQYAWCVSELYMSSSFITPRVVDWIRCENCSSIGQVVHTLLPRDVESFFVWDSNSDIKNLDSDSGPKIRLWLRTYSVTMIVHVRMTWDKFLNSSNKRCAQ